MANRISGTSFRDFVVLGSGAQTVDAGNGNDLIVSLGDGGEPDPAQTQNGAGRYGPPITPGSADDVITGGAVATGSNSTH